MLGIYSNRQLRELDACTIQREPVASIDLMERACEAFCRWFTRHIPEHQRVGIVCGTGNNGGDGLGIARLLTGWGYSVRVWIVRGQSAESKDFSTNLKRISGKIPIAEIVTDADLPDVEKDCQVVVDALFGTGLSRPVEGIYASVIQWVNRAQVVRIAVDVPSGLQADQPSDGDVVQAHHTVTFQFPKLAFLLPENAQRVGAWHMVDIRIHPGCVAQMPTSTFLLTRAHMKSLVKPRATFAHKGNFGHALLIAGSYGKMGAAVLAAKAVLRCGAGLLTVHAPAQGYGILQTSVPEAMVSADADQFLVTEAPSLEKYSVVGAGPGLGVQLPTVKALQTVMEACRVPMVLDADALNALSSHRELLHLIPKGSILTPHVGEFRRLVGDWKDDFHRLELQRSLASTTHSVVILKGAFSSICSPAGETYFNATGNAGMAKGGSGDALTGVLTGLLARGYTGLEAAQLGVWLHGVAGDLACEEMGQDSLLASDLVTFLPKAFRQLQSF
jgi:NAD(P)H-hydrate epimerase